jgi:hypothetical protein
MAVLFSDAGNSNILFLLSAEILYVQIIKFKIRRGSFLFFVLPSLYSKRFAPAPGIELSNIMTNYTNDRSGIAVIIPNNITAKSTTVKVFCGFNCVVIELH